MWSFSDVLASCGAGWTRPKGSDSRLIDTKSVGSAMFRAHELGTRTASTVFHSTVVALHLLVLNCLFLMFCANSIPQIVFHRIVESLESQHCRDLLLHLAMVLLHQIVQVLAGSNLDATIGGRVGTHKGSFLSSLPGQRNRSCPLPRNDSAIPDGGNCRELPSSAPRARRRPDSLDARMTLSSDIIGRRTFL